MNYSGPYGGYCREIEERFPVKFEAQRGFKLGDSPAAIIVEQDCIRFICEKDSSVNKPFMRIHELCHFIQAPESALSDENVGLSLAQSAPREIDGPTHPLAIAEMEVFAYQYAIMDSICPVTEFSEAAVRHIAGHLFKITEEMWNRYRVDQRYSRENAERILTERCEKLFGISVA